MGSKHFSSMPNISIPRSRWKVPFSHPFTMNHGQLIPVDCFEVVPGDGFAGRYSLVIRMSTPIAPIMGNIKAKLVAFYVPMRLLWEHTEEFYGANKTSAGYQQTTYKIPATSIFRAGIPVGSVSHHLGKPICSYNAGSNYGVASVLKERAYWFIWSEWYRAQQLQDPFIMNKGDFVVNVSSGQPIGTISGQIRNFASMPAQVCKQFDYFTACTLSPQYGAAVSLPLGSYAPVIGINASGNIAHGFTGSDVSTTGSVPAIGVAGQFISHDSTSGAAIKFDVDLSQATAATINSIRYAFQLQKYLERSNYGSRFFEMLNAHYGVTSPDARLQRPEYLGGFEFPIVVQQVLSTAGYQAGTSTEVGQPGATSVTAVKRHLFTKDFVEPGYLMVMLSTTIDGRAYTQGLMREDFLLDRFEHYSPEFANLGDQAILNKEIYLAGDDNDDKVFGYNEHWAELRYRKNYASGLLDPAASGSLNYWTLADNYQSRPSLCASWIVESRDEITRCLVTGSTGPDYICDMYAEYTATREMPVYTIPGLVDHFGVM